MILNVLSPTTDKYFNTGFSHFGMLIINTHVADVIIDNPAEEELRTVRDGLPCTKRVMVLLPVFNLRWIDRVKVSERV